MKQPRVALAQMNVVPGRPDLNVETMLRMLAEARDGGADVVAFPEMCVPGYILGDLWEQDALVADFAGWSETLREAADGIAVVFGNVVVDPNAINEDGRVRKYNAALVCANGEFVARPGVPASLPAGVQPKTLHPNYRFFDDDRHFYSLRKLSRAEGRALEDYLQPFDVPLTGGRSLRLGVQLCEDMWCADYSVDTLSMLHARGAELVVNLSASPWTWAKGDKRNRVVDEIVSRSPVPYCYVNNVGAQNNGKNTIVFDGDTTVYASSGEVQARAPRWREALLYSDSHDAPPREPLEDAWLNAIGTGLRHLDHLMGGRAGFLVGASGGIDSSLSIALLAHTFGPERVFAVNMPTRFNADVTKDNARRLCESLGVEHMVFPIEDLYSALSARIEASGFASRPGEYTGLVDENIQARIRGADVLAGLAARCGLVFTNNGNKTETALGYATLYGDVNGAVAPIADLYKTEVFTLARHLNEVLYGREVIPANLYDGSTVPSAELSEDQDVTRGLGDPIKYGYHDALLRQLIEFRRHPLELMQWYAQGELFERIGWDDRARFRGWFDSSEAVVADFEWLAASLRGSYFKRIQAPPIIVLSKRAFGFDLRESQLTGYEPRSFADARAAAAAAPLPAEQRGRQCRE